MNAAFAWYTASQLAELALPGLGTCARSIRRRAHREGWTSRLEPRNGGLTLVYSEESISAEARAVLDAAERPNLDTIPGSHRERTMARMRMVGRVHDLVGQGHTRTDAIARVLAEDIGDDSESAPSTRTLRRWVERCDGLATSDWFGALLPAWKSTSTRSECHQDAWEYWRDDYLRPAAPSKRECYRRMRDVAEANGWSPIPSVHYFGRRLSTEVPRSVQLLRREGEDALMRRYPSQERSVEHLYAMWGWNADGHVLDIMVRWPDGEIGRPTLLGFQDLYSRKIVGWAIDKSESGELVRLALADAVREHGIPEHLYLDNGRAFWNKSLTGGQPTRFRFQIRPEDCMGILRGIGINAHAVKPFRGKSKPIERAWKNLCEIVSRHPAFEGAYTGSNTESKPHNYGDRAIPFETLIALLPMLIKEHNERTGRRTKTARGRSFDATFRASLEGREVRRLTDDQQRMLFLSSRPIMVRRGVSHIEYGGNRYWNRALLDLEGQRVVVRFDPDDLKAGMFIYRTDGRYVAFAECILATGFDDERAKREDARKEANFKRAEKALSKATERWSHAELASAHVKAKTGVDLTPAAPLIALAPKPRVATSKPAEAKVRVGPTEAELALRQQIEDLQDEACGGALEALERRYLRVTNE